jgi:hypothetical protein
MPNGYFGAIRDFRVADEIALCVRVPPPSPWSSHEAPEAWMMGAHFTRVRAGMDCKAAYLDVMRHWAEQTQMAAEFEAAR